MSEQRPTNSNQFQAPYASNPTAPARPVAPGVSATPSALGVKPDARLANAFLSQAFLWMFAGLLVTAGVAYFVQSNASLLNFARGSAFLLIMVQLGIAVGIMGLINRISATVALGLFFVYAATLGISIVGVVLFTVLTAYDVQRIQSGDLAARLGSMEKAAVVGALQLYLDFINLFLFMLRLLGGRG